MATKDAAKEDVMAIARDYGFINPSTLEEIGRINPALRREVEEGMLAKDKKISHSIITLAKNVYSSNARFIFELLQNADDNQFTRAVLARKERPSISFKVFPDRIVIECNEDGFTKANLAAICSVGESTKAASHGYIGAKGIGFKSVFIAAWKVEIQSGNYSFYFRHDQGDVGLGMVLPVWQDVDEELPNSLTRITLHLHQKGDSEDIDHLHQTIFNQFNDLEHTCLLFLRNLKEIRVSFYDQDGEPRTSKMFCLNENTAGRVSLTTKSTDEHQKESIDIKKYYVTRYIGSGLPKSDNRKSPAIPKGQQNSAQAETVLAFPTAHGGQPVFAPQSVFAFLPIRKTAFKFLIQCDFDTSASRQDISSTSRRNIKLLDHIASAFCKAVLDFRSDKDFLYTWPLYLPAPEDATEPFWSELHLKILAKISQHEILRTRNNKLQKIAQTAIPAQYFKDSRGKVLLDNDEIDPFISDHYSSEAISSLQRYGLKIAKFKVVMSLLKKDVENPFSRLKMNNSSDDLQSRMAKLLSRNAKGSKSIRSELSSLTFFPLNNGTWVSLSSGPVHFPHSNGIAIPPGLDFRILDPIATANEDRKALFSILGIQELAVDVVRQSILSRNRSVSPGFNWFDWRLQISQSKRDLLFLYQAHQFPMETSQMNNMLKLIPIFSDESPTRSICPNKHDPECYLPSDDPYGPSLLLRSTNASPGMKVPFIHPIYLEGTPDTPSSDHPSWIEWLKDTVGVRERLSLISRDGQSLSRTWYYVAKHRPEKLFGYLKHAWEFEGDLISSTESLKLLLQETDVSRTSTRIVKLPRQCRLDETYLPLPSLVEQSREFLQEDDAFPFLQLEKSSNEEEINSNWLFLHSVLSVKKDDDIGFLLDILKWLKISNCDSYLFERVFDLYSAIFAKYSGSRNKMDLKIRIRAFFQTGDYIYAPNFARASVTTGACSRWISPGLCLLQGPENLISKYPLETKYRLFAADSDSKSDSSSSSSADENEFSFTMNLFSKVLDIKSPSMHDLIFELAYHRDHQNDNDFNSSSIFDLYKYMHGMDVSLSIQKLRREFRENPLVFVKTDSHTGWYKSSECLWSSTTEISGKVTLNAQYEELKEFFLDTLEVQTITLQMAYDDLLEAGSEASMEEIISKLWSLNALLLADDTYVDPKPLLRKYIFPVVFPGGSKALCSTRSEFAIGDREHLASQFRGKIKLLDFTQDEVRRLKAFFDWANLSHRYLSGSFKSLTSISGETTPFNPSPTRDLARKAHALLRPRYRANRLKLYKVLQAATFEVTDNIVSTLRVVQDGKTVDVEEAVAKLHISGTSSGLTIYIPRDRKAQEICFCDILPKKIVEWLMRDLKTQILEPVSPDMLKIVIMMFSIHPFAMDSVLDREGIIEVDIVNEDNRFEDVSSTTSHRPVRPVPRETHPTSRPFFNAPSPDNLQYRNLLDHVLQAARQASFPLHGAFGMAQLNQSLPRKEELGQYEWFDGPEIKVFFSSDSQSERGQKVGAAGELYAFELLKGLSLPDWSDSNWPSEIRRYVTIHPDYATMAPWQGRETADIVYDDTQGLFTALLIDRGYMEASEWGTMRPKYFIEIKTTTGPLGTPFSMSKAQFERMGAMHRRGDHSEVYMILRVFEIRGSSIGMRVYLDPEQLRLDGGLVFTGETWSVVPG